ncbi:hypothetical protein L1J49_05545 [Bifidobacterium breve]|uniref:Selenium binding protein n=1 Tax=Bifidobacterium breve TaxID=1685 RepID=A0AAN1M540_BIFBR|nr:hypothetical protein [Bifidobacterium breve]GDZ15171.1 hypothetical protein MCC01954_16380 [Bifidobacteriaceae bacterium MCC01954]AUD91144.1 hypothetical protein DRBB27_1019 [Bifidobacterium breve]AUE18574.1 hypothetical protein DRBB29_1020 [Bifidobacterium breve]MDG5962722.1 hypothetical protein [Bifidobacterium breve]MDG5969174.1 hypothetical protein [Bifidobacterium breve]
MYEPYTRQSLPDKEYRELLGSAICVFNSNVAFVIENILNADDADNFNWYDLIDLSAGDLSSPIKQTITKKAGSKIGSLFNTVVQQRNRILHSFQITETVSCKQILCTKDKRNHQFLITEDYLLRFIADNQKLSELLYAFRKQMTC